jgi:hypothetical protein
LQERAAGALAAVARVSGGGAGATPRRSRATLHTLPQACDVACGVLAAHWQPDGEAQRQLAAAVGGAQQAAGAAQSARRAAQLLGARLNAAAVLVQESAKVAPQISVVAHQRGQLGVEE